MARLIAQESEPSQPTAAQSNAERKSFERLRNEWLDRNTVPSVPGHCASCGQIESATRDAVRSASLERSQGAGLDAANDVADAQTNNRDCFDQNLTGGFAPGATITYTMTCKISFDELGLIGLPGDTEVTFSSDAPLDQFRRSA